MRSLPGWFSVLVEGRVTAAQAGGEAKGFTTRRPETD